MTQSQQQVLDHLTQVLESRKLANGGDPATSYVSQLLSKAPDSILKKIGEESTEVVMAAKELQVQKGDAKALVYEVADLWFHSLVLLAHFDLSAQDVLQELARREGLGGLVEKAARKR